MQKSAKLSTGRGAHYRMLFMIYKSSLLPEYSLDSTHAASYTLVGFCGG